MAEPAPDVSVVMAARDAAGTIESAIAGIADQKYDGAIELIVAEGGSTDSTRRVLDRLADAHPWMTAVSNPGLVTPAGLNAAVAASSADIIVRCDAHCVLPPDYVATAVATLTESGADVVGGVQDPRGTTPIQRAIAAAMRSRLGSGGAAYRTGRHAGPTDTVYLGVFRRAALERVGGYDEDLVRNQDYELNYRIRATGGIVWLDPRLRVTYRPRGSLPALWRQYFDYGRWKRRVLRLHPASARLRQLVPPAFVAALAVSVALLSAGFIAVGLIVPVAYAAGATITAVTASIAQRDWSMLLLPAAVTAMHVAWGLGFLIGPPRRRAQTASDA